MIQPVRQRYNTHSGAVFCRLDNNNAESAWQSADGRVTLPQLFRDRSAIFVKNCPNCSKRLKNVVWQSADGRVTSDHCRVAVQLLYPKFRHSGWNVEIKVVRQSADGRVTVRRLSSLSLFPLFCSSESACASPRSACFSRLGYFCFK